MKKLELQVIIILLLQKSDKSLAVADGSRMSTAILLRSVFVSFVLYPSTHFSPGKKTNK